MTDSTLRQIHDHPSISIHRPRIYTKQIKNWDFGSRTGNNKASSSSSRNEKKGKKDSKVDIIIWTKPMLDEDAQNR